MKAVWKDTILAESDNTIVIEGNHYFPPNSIKKELLKETDTHTTCPWKGEASYYDITVKGETNSDAAWFYSSPSEAAAEINDHVAFWKGVEVSD